MLGPADGLQEVSITPLVARGSKLEGVSIDFDHKVVTVPTDQAVFHRYPPGWRGRAKK